MTLEHGLRCHNTACTGLYIVQSQHALSLVRSLSWCRVVPLYPAALCSLVHEALRGLLVYAAIRLLIKYQNIVDVAQKRVLTWSPQEARELREMRPSAASVCGCILPVYEAFHN